MANALEVINSDPKVRSIFINIFGGITRGEDVANGIVTALGRVDIDVADRHPPRRHQRRGGPGDLEDGRVRHASSRQPTMLAAARKAVELADAGTPEGASK